MFSSIWSGASATSSRIGQTLSSLFKRHHDSSTSSLPENTLSVPQTPVDSISTADKHSTILNSSQVLPAAPGPSSTAPPSSGHTTPQADTDNLETPVSPSHKSPKSGNARSKKLLTLFKSPRGANNASTSSTASLPPASEVPLFLIRDLIKTFPLSTSDPYRDANPTPQQIQAPIVNLPTSFIQTPPEAPTITISRPSFDEDPTLDTNMIETERRQSRTFHQTPLPPAEIGGFEEQIEVKVEKGKRNCWWLNEDDESPYAEYAYTSEDDNSTTSPHSYSSDIFTSDGSSTSSPSTPATGTFETLGGAHAVRNKSSFGWGRAHGSAAIVVRDPASITRTKSHAAEDLTRFLARVKTPEVYGGGSSTNASDEWTSSSSPRLGVPSISSTPSRPMARPFCTRRIDEPTERASTSVGLPNASRLIASSPEMDHPTDFSSNDQSSNGSHVDDDLDYSLRVPDVRVLRRGSDVKPTRRVAITRARSFSPKSSPLARQSLHVEEDNDEVEEPVPAPTPVPKRVRVSVLSRIARKITSIGHRRQNRA
ncbi:hypothetical protein FRB97_009724 [Tulasnella sp. 331]|nr:hypothetical protein FRB97_009724 [Tulasnella sp. 331]